MELLITVLTLGAAIYALVPRARQLELQLRLGLAEWTIIAVASAAVFYLQFYDFFQAQGLVLHERWPQGITPQNSIYLVLIGASAAVVCRVRLTRLSKGKIQKFRKLIEELYWAGSYGELFTLLEDNAPDLFRIARSEFLWSRLRTKLQPFSWQQLTHSDLERVMDEINRLAESPAKGRHLFKRGSKLSNSIRRRVRGWIFNWLPEYDPAQRTAQELARTILVLPQFVRALVQTRPYLGLEILRDWNESLEFSDLYLTELVRDPTSALYQEIARNENILTGHRYVIPESNRVLHFFLSDAKRAYDMNVYRPVGNYALSHLDELARNPETDPYNLALGDFQESGAFNSPLFIVIRFFDIMVPEALHQGIKWHMWLYYMPRLVEGIVRNYRLNDPLAEPYVEWPIRYNFLLYEIFSSLCGWVEGVESLPPEQANVKLESTRANLENGNIPKSSILALCQCARFVLESDNLTDRSKRYLTDMVFRLYFRLRSKGQLHDYARVLRNAIAQGGSYQRRNDEKYRLALATVFKQEKDEYEVKHPDAYVAELEEVCQ